jgi:hypothetical protein
MEWRGTEITNNNNNRDDNNNNNNSNNIPMDEDWRGTAVSGSVRWPVAGLATHLFLVVVDDVVVVVVDVVDVVG